MSYDKRRLNSFSIVSYFLKRKPMAHKKPLKRPYRLSTQVIACSLSSPPRLPTSDVFFCRPEVYSFTHLQYLNGYSASDYIYGIVYTNSGASRNFLEKFISRTFRYFTVIARRRPIFVMFSN